MSARLNAKEQWLKEQTDAGRALEVSKTQLKIVANRLSRHARNNSNGSISNRKLAAVRAQLPR